MSTLVVLAVVVAWVISLIVTGVYCYGLGGRDEARKFVDYLRRKKEAT